MLHKLIIRTTIKTESMKLIIMPLDDFRPVIPCFISPKLSDTIILVCAARFFVCDAVARLRIKITPTEMTKSIIAKCKKLISIIVTETGWRFVPRLFSNSKISLAKPNASPVTKAMIAFLELIFFEKSANKNTATIGGLINPWILCRRR